MLKEVLPEQSGFIFMPKRVKTFRPQKKANVLSGFRQSLESVYQSYQGFFRNPFGAGVGAAPSYTDNVYKAVIPAFLYKPAFGYPLNKDVPELRRLAKTPYVAMITNTAVNEMAALEWKIVKAEGAEDVPDEIITKTTNFFNNPNRNDESLETILRAYVRDILELDAGLITKVRNLKDEFVEMYARDGGTFTKSPDIYGVMPEFNAYYQFGWLTGARPIPFNFNEILYSMLFPRSDSIYGLSPVEVLQDVIQLLVYGVDDNLGYYNDNAIAKGVFQMIGADKDDITAFRASWFETMKKKDPSGKWRKDFHRMPIINTDGKFVRTGFSNLELETLGQQQWFSKIVWACFNMTAEELGFTEDSNKAISQGQRSVLTRKLIKPVVNLIEYQFTTQLVNDLPWIKGKYEDKVLFVFDMYDFQEEMARRQMHWGDIKVGLRPVNEVREELDWEPLEGGDDLRQQGGNTFGFQTTGNTGKVPSETEDQVSQDNEDFMKAQKKNLNTSSPLAPKKFEKPDIIGKAIDEVIVDLTTKMRMYLKREAGQKTLEEIKAIDQNFIKNLMALVSFSQLKTVVDNSIKSAFMKGLDKAENDLERNFSPNMKAIDFIQNYTFDNVKDLGEDLKNDLRQELERGIMNGEGVPKLSKRVDAVMDVGKVRAKAIARTETNRAENFGTLDGYKQSGIKGKKEWINTDPQAAVCKHLAGTEVGLDAKFTYKGQEFEAPPAHVNCRSTIGFVPDKE